MNGINPFLAHKMLEDKKRELEQETFKEMITFADKVKNLQTKFKEGMDRTNGVISTSMGVNTKSDHKLEYKGYYVMIDGKMTIEDFNELKEKLKIG